MKEKIHATVHEGSENEFMLTPVPMEARRSTFSQVMVWVGFGYVVTGLFVGGVLAGFGGKPGVLPGTAVLAVTLGMGTLFLLTSALGIIAQKTGLNLALLSRYSYGSKGKIIPMSVMALLTLGWFASITGMVGDIWGKYIGNKSGVIVFDPANMGFSDIPPITLEVFLACIIAGALFTITASIGIKAIEAVALPVAPIILIIAIAVGVGMLNEGGGFDAFLEKASLIDGLGLGNAITVVVGSWIAGAVMGVDLFRFNKSVKAVFLCAAACFIFTNPLLNLVGYVGAVQVGQYNYVAWMAGISGLFALVGVFAWTTSLWTTNNAELYCNALYVGPILDSFKVKVNRKVIVIIAGILGTILGAAAFYQIFFADFINVLGAAAPPLAAPLLADFFVVGRGKYKTEHLNKQPKFRVAGIISFAVGAILGLLFQYVWTLPLGLPSGLFAMVVAFFVYILIYPMTPDKKADQALA